LVLRKTADRIDAFCAGDLFVSWPSGSGRKAGLVPPRRLAERLGGSMQSISICLFGLGMIGVGGALMHLQYRGLIRHETLIAGIGVAFIACGVAVIKDGASGSREILWMLPTDARQHALPSWSSAPLADVQHL
jgi:hypothetical protein